MTTSLLKRAACNDGSGGGGGARLLGFAVEQHFPLGQLLVERNGRRAQRRLLRGLRVHFEDKRPAVCLPVIRKSD